MEKIQWNGEEFLVQLDPLMMKAHCTVRIAQGDNHLWVSCLLNALDNKYHSFKQLSVNYHSAIFTRVGDKKNNGKDTDYDTLISRNIDRSLRSHIPENFPYSINIDCWNPEAIGRGEKTIEEFSNHYFVMGLIGANIALLSLNIINDSIMPIHITKEKCEITGAVHKEKISNLEISSGAVEVEKIDQALSPFLFQYGEYNNSLKHLFHNTIKNLAEKTGDPIYLYSIIQLLERIELFHRKEIITNSMMKKLIERLLKSLNMDHIEMFLHGQFDKNMEKIILHYLNQEEISYLNNSLFYEAIFSAIKENLLCNKIIKTKKREDNRKLEQEREIHIENYPLSNFHSGIFLNKGKTRLLVGAYFFDGEKNMEIASQNKQRSFGPKVNVKYIFNQFINPKRSANSRREIGHCNLIQKSINNNIKEQEDNLKAFCNCYVTNSDGSSSMLSVIGCALLLHRFGFPIMEPTAGVSIGLIEDHEKGKENERFLVDITENEDFYCSMDMKVVATNNGIISAQLDVKNEGITLATLKKALELAQKTINKIIKKLYTPSNIAIIKGPHSLTIPIPHDDAMNNINNYKLFLQKQFSVIIFLNLEKKFITVIGYDEDQLLEAQERIIKDNWLTPKIQVIYLARLHKREEAWYVYCFAAFHPITLSKKQISLLKSGSICSVVLKDNTQPISFILQD